MGGNFLAHMKRDHFLENDIINDVLLKTVILIVKL